MFRFNVGYLFVAIGLFFLIYILPFDTGTMKEIGPGFFPRVVSSLLIMLGLFIIIQKRNND